MACYAYTFMVILSDTVKTSRDIRIDLSHRTGQRDITTQRPLTTQTDKLTNTEQQRVPTPDPANLVKAAAEFIGFI